MEMPTQQMPVEETPDTSPAKALQGYVDLEFVVTEEGGVERIVVLQSTDPMFEPAAVKAAAKFSYKPRIVDGKPVAVSGVRTRITFELENEKEKESEGQE